VEYDAMSLGKQFPVFERNVMPSYLMVWSSKVIL